MIDDHDERHDADSLAAGEPRGSGEDAPPLRKEPFPSTGSAADRDEELPRDKFRRSAQSRGVGAHEEEAEEQLWEGGYSPKAMVGTWVMCVVLTVAAIVAAAMFEQLPWLATLAAVVLLWVIVAVVYASRRLGVHYQLTTQRFIHQTGILSRRTDRIEVIDIDDVSYEQGPVQRMFGIGSIRIDSSDRSHPVLTMRGISAVHDVAGLIDDIRRKERRRRSLHIESV